MYIIYSGTKDESEPNYQTVSMSDTFEMTQILIEDNICTMLQQTLN